MNNLDFKIVKVKGQLITSYKTKIGKTTYINYNKTYTLDFNLIKIDNKLKTRFQYFVRIPEHDLYLYSKTLEDIIKLKFKSTIVVKCLEPKVKYIIELFDTNNISYFNATIGEPSIIFTYD
jgi:hypothetical protein